VKDVIAIQVTETGGIALVIESAVDFTVDGIEFWCTDHVEKIAYSEIVRVLVNGRSVLECAAPQPKEGE